MTSMCSNRVGVNYIWRELTATSFRVGSSLVEIDDNQIGQNIARLRGAMSQKDLALAMRDRGHKWSQATVWNVERGERPLRLSEATALVDVLELQSVQSISAPEEEFEYLATVSRLHEASRDLVLQADKVLRIQRELAEILDVQKVKSRDEGGWHQLELEIKLTPAEIVYDFLTEQLPLLRAGAEASGPWSEMLLKAVEDTDFTSPTLPHVAPLAN